MHEISLSIELKDLNKPKYRCYKPVGSFVSIWSDNRKKRKWVEIFCNHARPEKRAYWGPKLESVGLSPTAWSMICDLWQPVWFESWLSACRTFNPVEFITLPHQIWNEEIDHVLDYDDLGKDPTGTMYLSDTVLWSEHTRKNKLIITNSDYTEFDLKSKIGNETVVVDDKVIVRPKAKIDWELDIGLSEKSILDVKDKSKIINPRFDIPIAKEKEKPCIEDVEIKVISIGR